MVDRERSLKGPDFENLSRLYASIPSDKSFSVASESGNFIGSNSELLCSINKDGLKVLGPLFSNKSIGNVISSLSQTHQGTSEVKVQQETITFLRRLYARSLIQLVGETGEVKIPSWAMEPVTDVHLFITHKCNLDCIHCLIVKEKRKELSVADFMNVIDDFINLGCTHLDITGGETTTKKGFLDIVERANSKNLTVGLATNGTNWDKQNLERLISLRPNKVNISIYSSNPHIHDQITRMAGSFEKSVSLVKKLVNSSIRVNFKCMIMKENFDSFASVKQLAEDLGVEYQFDAHITSKINGDLAPLEHRIADFQLWEFINSPECTIRDEKIVTSDTTVCNAGRDRASVNPYGDVSPCAVFPISIGNVKYAPLSEIWEKSPTLNEIRSMRFKDMGKCGSCTLLSQCSPCPGASFLEQGSFKESPEWSCKFTNTIVKVKKGGDKNDNRSLAGSNNS